MSYSFKQLSIRGKFFVALLSLILWVSTSAVFLFSKNSKIGLSIVTSFIAWSTMYSIHKVSTGRIVDLDSETEDRPLHDVIDLTEDREGILLGLSSLSAGAIILSEGLKANNFTISTVGTSIMIIGFFGTHYIMTGGDIV